jgi:hypothetical protein
MSPAPSGTFPPYDVAPVPGGNHAAPVFPNFPVTPQSTSGLQFLRDQVAGYFLAEDIPAVVAKVGLKYRSFQMNVTSLGGANRVVFIPGKFDGSAQGKARDYGTLSRNTRNSSVSNPREIAEWERPCTISVWSAPDPTAPQEEDLALVLVEDLLEKVVRGLYSAALVIPDNSEENFSTSGAFSLGAVAVNAPPTESGYGVELLVQLTLRGAFVDKTLDVVYPTLKIPRPTFGG